MLMRCFPVISYYFPNEQNYPSIPAVLEFSKRFELHSLYLVEQTIANFNSEHTWSNMWGIEEAKDRLDNGHKLFIGTDHLGALAHVWFEDGLLYNLYIHSRRPNNYSKKFILNCLNKVNFHTITLEVDEWNIKAQRLYEKVGFNKLIT